MFINSWNALLREAAGEDDGDDNANIAVNVLRRTSMQIFSQLHNHILNLCQPPTHQAIWNKTVPVQLEVDGTHISSFRNVFFLIRIRDTCPRFVASLFDQSSRVQFAFAWPWANFAFCSGEFVGKSNEASEWGREGGSPLGSLALVPLMRS